MQGCSKTETCHAGRRPKNRTFGFDSYKSGVPMQFLYTTFYEITQELLAVAKLSSFVVTRTLVITDRSEAWNVYGRSGVSRRGCTGKRHRFVTTIS